MPIVGANGWRPCRDGFSCKGTGWLLVAFGVASVPSALPAQLAATAIVQSDYRFRGRSLSQGKPVATIDVSYDDRSGLYVGGSATAVLGGVEVAGLLAQQAYAGYAIRDKSGASFDVGVIAARYTSLYGGGREDSHAEAYIGVSQGAVSTQIRFAPSYFGRGTPVVYGELAATRDLAPHWRLNGHIGVLAQTSGSPSLGGKRVRYDVRAGVSRAFGRLELAADWTLGGPAGSYFDGPWQGRSAVVLAVRRSF